MGFYLRFCLVPVGYLILFGVEIVSELILLLRLQMVLGSVMRRIVWSVALSTANPPHTHWTTSFPTYGIADRRFVITGAPQNDICLHGRTYSININKYIYVYIHTYIYIYIFIHIPIYLYLLFLLFYYYLYIIYICM